MTKEELATDYAKILDIHRKWNSFISEHSIHPNHGSYSYLYGCANAHHKVAGDSLVSEYCQLMMFIDEVEFLKKLGVLK